MRAFLSKARKAAVAAVSMARGLSTQAIALAGCGLFAYGWSLVYSPLGYIIGGVLLFLIALDSRS